MWILNNVLTFKLFIEQFIDISLLKFQKNMDLIRVRMNVLMKKIKNIKKTSMIHWSDFAIRSYPFLSLGLQLVRGLYQSDCRQARCILMSNTPSYTGIHTHTHTQSTDLRCSRLFFISCFILFRLSFPS